ncbi:MAG: DUF4333 domain-containing protein [Leptospiraceae bacterium]|nr:DUF4333 domain-containing protein [Leptospiraceae bacterium]MCP5497109.1 DUF4333 domain-containing protein [Leptospiraceae bacterium]
MKKIKYLLIVIVQVSITLMGCSPTIDTQQVEGVIQEGFVQKTGIEVKSISCPKDIKPEPNTTFNCKLKAKDGSEIDLVVTQKDDQGNITWNADKGLISLPKLAKSIDDSIKQQKNIDVNTDCGSGEFKIAHTNDTFDCNITDGTGNTTVAKITVKDEDGNVSWETLPKQSSADEQPPEDGE